MGGPITRPPPRAGTILDVGNDGGMSVPASTYVEGVIAGTVWPMLQKRIYRIYNLSAVVQAQDSSRKLLLDDLTLYLAFYSDPNGAHSIGNIPIGAQGFNSTPFGLGGVAISESGDPLVAFQAGIQITKNSLGGPGSFQVVVTYDVDNTDAGAAHGCIGSFAMLFDNYSAG